MPDGIDSPPTAALARHQRPIESRIFGKLGTWQVSKSLEGLDPSTIPPRYFAKGSYFTMSSRAPFKRLIYPLPSRAGLGVHLTSDLGGQLRFGPDVEWVDPEQAAVFYEATRRYWPALPDGVLAPGYAGIRPRITGPGETPGDFVIQGPKQTGHSGYVALYGIDSPRLTASLAMGEYVASLAS